MTLTVPLGLDNFGTARIATETTLFGQSTPFTVVVRHTNHLLYNIIDSFIDTIILLLVITT